jgi:hypothetical protein
LFSLSKYPFCLVLGASDGCTLGLLPPASKDWYLWSSWNSLLSWMRLGGIFEWPRSPLRLLLPLPTRLEEPSGKTFPKLSF